MFEKFNISSKMRLNITCVVLILSSLGIVWRWHKLVEAICADGAHDFNQYYCGALVFCKGKMHCLYPKPIVGGKFNAGKDAIPAIEYVELCNNYGINIANFIQPPTATWLLAPLACFDFSISLHLFLWICMLCVYGSLALSCYLAKFINISFSIIDILLISCVVSHIWFHRIYSAISIGNISPIIGFLITLAVICAVHNRPILGSIPILVAAFLKISPVILLWPLILLMNFRQIVFFLLFIVSLLIIDQFFIGIGPWITYITEIFPTLSRVWLPDPDDIAQDHTTSIFGLIYSLFGFNPLPPFVDKLLKINFVFGTLFIIWLIFFTRSLLHMDSNFIVGSMAILVGWPIIAAPLSWGHYSYYFIGLTFWMVGFSFSSNLYMKLLGIFFSFLTFAPWGRLMILCGVQWMGEYVYMVNALILLFSGIILLVSNPFAKNSVNTCGL